MGAEHEAPIKNSTMIDKLKDIFRFSKQKGEESDYSELKVQDETPEPPKQVQHSQVQESLADKYRRMFGEKKEAKRLTVSELAQFFPGAFSKEDREKLISATKKEQDKQFSQREADLIKFPIDDESKRKRKRVYQFLRDEYGIDAQEPKE